MSINQNLQFIYKKLGKKYKKFMKTSFAQMLFYAPFNALYFCKILKFYNRQIDLMPQDTQIFFMGREDLGTHLYMLHYMQLWEKARGPVALLVFSRNAKTIERLAKILLPNTPLIYPQSAFDRWALLLFGEHTVFYHTLLKVYAKLAVSRPDFPHMFDLATSSHSSYNAFLDPYKELDVPSLPFLEAYRKVRGRLDYRLDVFKDYCSLYHHVKMPPFQIQKEAEQLRKHLGIQKPYVVMNINQKTYSGAASRRTINYPHRYESLIDALIQKGYQVVIQGREEQPYFKPRSDLIDYSKSRFCSIENDFLLYANCAFVIASKSGIEIFGTICNVPVLGLNYTEILGMQPAKKLRFYPKHVQDKATGRMLGWQELLLSPHFFDMGHHSYGESVQYVDLEEKEMLEALEEFLPLLEKEDGEWMRYSALQQSFKDRVSPLHVELYFSRGVPCDAYLKKQGIHGPY